MLAAYTSGMRFLSFVVVVIPVWYLFRASASTATRLLSAYFLIWPLYIWLCSVAVLSRQADTVMVQRGSGDHPYVDVDPGVHLIGRFSVSQSLK